MRARPLILLLFAVGLATVLALSLRFALTTSAGGLGCEVTYTVERGDTLNSIAGRLDTTVDELLRLNRGVVRNPDRIYVGQELCVPADSAKHSEGEEAGKDTAEGRPPDQSTANMPAAQAAIEVTYQFMPTEDEDGWSILTSRGGQVGKRLVYPLQPGLEQPAEYITETIMMPQILREQPTPSLLAVRQITNPFSYILVFIDQGPPVSASLHISDTALTHRGLRTCEGVGVKEVLAIEGTKAVSVTLWLEADDGLRFPFPVSHVSYMGDELEAADCYRGAQFAIGLALVPASPDTALPRQETSLYQAVVLLQHDEFGPAGNVKKANCDRWRGKRGLTYRWLRAFTRCR